MTLSTTMMEVKLYKSTMVNIEGAKVDILVFEYYFIKSINYKCLDFVIHRGPSNLKCPFLTCNINKYCKPSIPQ